MDPMASKYPLWKKMLHKFQARRDIPFRKKFFVGYDLHGNTYWEFTIDGNRHKLRRKLEPFKISLFKADYFETIPPQWLQWLRRTKRYPPTLQELIDDQIRQQRIKILAMEADRKWIMEKERLEYEQYLKLQAELNRVEKEKRAFEAQQTETSADSADNVREKGHVESKGKESADLPNTENNPWADADTTTKEYPIESAFLKPKK